MQSRDMEVGHRRFVQVCDQSIRSERVGCDLEEISMTGGRRRQVWPIGITGRADTVKGGRVADVGANRCHTPLAASAKPQCHVHFPLCHVELTVLGRRNWPDGIA